MPTKLVAWQDLLSEELDGVEDQYGPNSQAVACALMTIGDIRWLENVGEPWLESATEPPVEVDIVTSWDDALTIFSERPKYNINGVLQVAHEKCARIIDGDPARTAWWQKARQDAKQFTHIMGWLPTTLPKQQHDLLFENIYEYVSMLLAEIVASAEGPYTYFRQQLPWFVAGHFPCGWSGEWPSGSLRVF